MQLQHNDNFPFAPTYLGSMEHCAVCGRKTSKNALLVEVYGGGAIHDETLNGEADRNDGGYMGHYPVGSECAKKFATTTLKKAGA